MIRFSAKSIDSLSYIFRINLINSCTGFKSANLIGTRSKDGISNVAVFSSVTHIGSNPPLIGFFTRPTTVTRDTYENIKETGEFSINHIHESITVDAHHTSAKYDKNISEFDMTNLEEEIKPGFRVPFVKSSPVQIALKFVEEIPISANNTILVIGQVKELFVDEKILNDDGYLDLTKANVAAINGLDGYTIPKLKERLSYQKPEKKSA